MGHGRSRSALGAVLFNERRNGMPVLSVHGNSFCTAFLNSSPKIRLQETPSSSLVLILASLFAHLAGCGLFSRCRKASSSNVDSGQSVGRVSPELRMMFPEL